MRKSPMAAPVAPPPPPLAVAATKPLTATQPKKQSTVMTPSLPNQVDRAAVMADIRRAPRLRRVDRSLIEDRSDAGLYFGSSDVSGRLVTVHLSTSSRPPSSAGSSHSSVSLQSPNLPPIRNSSSSSGRDTAKRNKAGGANGAIQHPVLTLYRRTPSPSAVWLATRVQSTTPSPEAAQTEQERGRRRPASALAALARVVTRSASPSTPSNTHTTRTVSDDEINATVTAASARTPSILPSSFHSPQPPPRKTTIKTATPAVTRLTGHDSSAVVAGVKRQAPPVPTLSNTSIAGRPAAKRSSTDNAPAFSLSASLNPASSQPAHVKTTTTDSRPPGASPVAPSRLSRQPNRSQSTETVWARVQKSSSTGPAPVVYAGRRREQQGTTPEPGAGVIPLSHIHYPRSPPWVGRDLQRASSPSQAYLALSLSPPPSRRIVTVTNTQATFESKYTFRSVTNLLAPDTFTGLPKTYPSRAKGSSSNVYETIRYAAPTPHYAAAAPPKRSLLA